MKLKVEEIEILLTWAGCCKTGKERELFHKLLTEKIRQELKKQEAKNVRNKC